MKSLLAGALLALVVTIPGLAAALLAALGAACVWAAAQPPVLAFALGAATWPRITKRIARIIRSTP